MPVTDPAATKVFAQRVFSNESASLYSSDLSSYPFDPSDLNNPLNL